MMSCGRLATVGFWWDSKRRWVLLTPSLPTRVQPKLEAGLVTQPCTSEISVVLVQSKKPRVVVMVAEALAVALNWPPGVAQVRVLKKRWTQVVSLVVGGTPVVSFPAASEVPSPQLARVRWTLT